MEKEIDNLIITPPDATGESASRAYTDWLRSIETDIPEELKKIVPRKAAEEYYNKLCEIHKNKQFDRAADPFKRLVSVLTKAFPDFEEEFKKSGLDNLPFTDENLKALLEFLAIWVNKLPAFNELDYTFLKYISEQFNKYKSSSDYLTRLVHKRLEAINPSILDKSLSTRLLILKQFIHQFGCGKVVLDDDEKKVTALASPHTRSGKTVKAIENRQKGEPNANSYYSRKIENMCAAKFGSSYETMSKELTEADFDKLLADKECSFAKIADSLAKAYFSAQRKTREYLYIFAIAFEMRFNTNTEASQRINSSSADHDWTDIQKNLFFDFYNFNLINKRKGRTEENFVDGYGINWRNFVEVCYVYFLNKDMSAAEKFYKAFTTWTDGMAVGNTKTSDPATGAKPIQYNPSMRTAAAKKLALTELLTMDEDSFKNFATLRFRTKKKTKDENAGIKIPIRQNDERTTANSLCHQIEKLVDTKEEKDISADKKADYTKSKGWAIAFPDKDTVPAYSNPLIIVDDLESQKKQIKPPLYISSELAECINRVVGSASALGTDTTRMRLLFAFSSYIFAKQYQQTADKNLSCFDRFFAYFAKEAEITLTVIETTESFVPSKSTNGFPMDEEVYQETEVKRTFRGANELLIYAGYQEIYCGNLFDMLLIYQTFRKCCMGWGYTEE